MVRYIRTSGLVLLMAAITLAPVAPVYAQAAQTGSTAGSNKRARLRAAAQQSGQRTPIPTVTVNSQGRHRLRRPLKRFRILDRENIRTANRGFRTLWRHTRKWKFRCPIW